MGKSEGSGRGKSFRRPQVDIISVIGHLRLAPKCKCQPLASARMPSIVRGRTLILAPTAMGQPSDVVLLGRYDLRQ